MGSYLTDDFKPYTLYNNPIGVLNGGFSEIKDTEDYWEKKARIAQTELANKPRYDIEGDKRYGNTLSDDMFSIKNPANRRNAHAPESYDYTSKPTEPLPVFQPKEEVAPQSPDFSSLLGNVMPTDYREGIVGRKKNVTGDGLDWDLDREWGLVDDALEYEAGVDADTYDYLAQLQQYNALQNTINDLGTDSLREDMRYQRSGDPRESEDWIIRRGAEYDPYLETLVNYNRLSPQTKEQLVKMGVNRPEPEPTFSDIEDEALRQSLLEDYRNGLLVLDSPDNTLNSILNAYRYAMEHGYTK